MDNFINTFMMDFDLGSDVSSTSSIDNGSDTFEYGGKILVIGCGSIGLGILPLLLRHIRFTQKNPLFIWTAPDRQDIAEAYGRLHNIPVSIGYLTPDNYIEALNQFNLEPGDFMMNLSVDVSSLDLIRWCRPKGVLYMDTCIEPWPGTYTNPSLSVSERSNYALREEALELARSFPPNAPTAILTHGANPGMVSHFMKQALLNIAAAISPAQAASVPQSREEWAQLSRSLGVQAVHISERDTQYSTLPRAPTDFYNTWSVDGFLSEGCQPAEMGWGTHESALPRDGENHKFGCGAAIFLNRPGAGTRVRSWTPGGGAHLGFLITHSEAISIADYFTVKSESSDSSAEYRPTVHYAYRPCDSAVLALEELAVQNWDPDFFTNKRVLVDEIEGGVDELGVLLMGCLPPQSTAEEPRTYAYWYGSQLDCKDARARVEHNSATTLQVTSALLAAFVWALKNPQEGIVEPESLPFDQILDVMEPYIAPVNGVFTDWNPVSGRGKLFQEEVDKVNTWQFKNLRFE